tara:strand:+ start:334 stop:750 length:417 start_codon:yes stop_codon:yes gene_type:complete
MSAFLNQEEFATMMAYSNNLNQRRLHNIPMVCAGRHDDGTACTNDANERGVFCDLCDPVPDIRRNLEEDFEEEFRNYEKNTKDICVPQNNNEIIECPICFVEQCSERCVKLSCDHIFCGVCLVKTSNRLCPFCRTPFT